LNYKLTIGLLAVLLVVGAYIYFTEIQPEPQQGVQAAEIIGFKAADLTAITVSSQGKLTELRKEGSYWKLKKPEEAETQSGVVDGLVARIAPLKASRSLTESGEPLSSYGLENPNIEATIKTGDGKSLVLQVGDNTPDGSASYVKRKDSEQVYTVPSQIGAELAKWVTTPPKALPTPTPTPRPIGTPVPVPTTTP